MFKKLVATAAVAVFTLTSFGMAASAAPAQPPAVYAPVVVSQAAITPVEATDLQFMREEEKLAHDVYVFLYEEWGLPVFSNISASEQQHTDAVAVLLDRYNVADPADGNAAGEFENADLQALYETLIAQGSESLGAALKVGGAIEEIDILDLEERLAETTKADIVQVYQNLESGSENHLRAFVSTLKTQTGETYVPQYLDQAKYNEIVAGTTGGRRGGRW